jgi:hypothetical protein
MNQQERTNGLVSPAQMGTCNHATRNTCPCDWGDYCSLHSGLDFNYCTRCGEKLEEKN